MGKKKVNDAEKLVTVQAAVPVVIWQVNRPLNDEQYDALERRLRASQENTGMRIMLVPYSVDVEVAAELEESQAAGNGAEEPPLPPTDVAHKQAPQAETAQEKTDATAIPGGAGQEGEGN
ncbi:hypothetical protein [Paenibacillus thermotolerans]|uniref:hypothetical protein n=1 Tax=Paenibacillus thermotolerans TaxID=3027807 RepID=UPI0023683A2E|nr:MULTISPECIES: hypothetical protein [unclassified Paenibacillus]